jgi:hypothetical protein
MILAKSSKVRHNQWPETLLFHLVSTSGRLTHLDFPSKFVLPLTYRGLSEEFDNYINSPTVGYGRDRVPSSQAHGE